MPLNTPQRVLSVLLATFVLAIVAISARVPFGNWLLAEGIEAKKAWKLESAIAYLDWAEFLGDRQDEALYEKALCYQLRGEYIKSQRESEKLLANSIINQELKARVLNLNGANHFNQNEPDKALLSHRESLKIARLINSKQAEAIALIASSRVLYHAKGEFDTAKTHLEKALEIAREINDQAAIAGALRHIGVVLWWGKGELDRPLEEYYKPALALYRKNGDLSSEATMLSNIALINSFKGDWFTYLRLQNEALEIRKSIKDQGGLSDSYRALGTSHLHFGNLRKANEFFLRSSELSKNIGYRLTQNESETFLAASHVSLGEYDRAIELFSQILERHKDSPELAKSPRAAIAQSYLLKGDLERAKDSYLQIYETELKSSTPDLRTIAASATNLGDIYLRTGNVAEAKEFLKKAEVIYTKHTSAIVRGYLGYAVVRAELRYEEGKYDEALTLLQTAADDELNLFSSTGTNVITKPLSRTYDRLFDLLLKKLNIQSASDENDLHRAEQLAFQFLEQRRYRSFRNFIVRSSATRKSTSKISEEERSALAKIDRAKKSLKRANRRAAEKNLSEAYRDYENIALKTRFPKATRRAITSVSPVKLKTAQEKLDESTALIEYVFAGERVFALVARRNDIRSFLLPITRSNLQNKIRLLQSSISFKGKENEDWKPIATSLRQSLIGPVEESGILEDSSRLAIVPFGILHDLPFAVLTKKENGRDRFLIEEYVLFFPPSVTFLAVESGGVKPKGLLSVGRNSTKENDLPPLRFAVEEARSVAYIFSGQSRLEEGASETELKKLAPMVSHLHIATHAVAEPDMPLFSRMLLGNSKQDDGSLTVSEIFKLGIDAELVTIAACEGAKSFSVDTEQLVEIDRLGLAEAFLHAGSKSVLASLSPVSDESTTELMKSFYKNLLTEEKADSLALAQRSMLKGEIKEKFTHPRYWSNFVLIGTNR